MERGLRGTRVNLSSLSCSLGAALQCSGAALLSPTTTLQSPAKALLISPA